MSNQSAKKGLLGTKLGMTQVFDENNRVVPVTVIATGFPADSGEQPATVAVAVEPAAAVVEDTPTVAEPVAAVVEETPVVEQRSAASAMGVFTAM